jgi:glucokinase
MLDGDDSFPSGPGGRERLLLAGDVGGTKVDLAVVSPERGPRMPLAKRRYASGDYSSLAELARAFLAEASMEVEAACFDVAGPVIDGEARLTNLPWEISETSLRTALGVQRVWLLNDLVATASAIPLLRADELYPVKEGHAVPGGTVAVLAPGTGLGEAFLTQEVHGYRAHASEGGHAAFAPTSELEVELLNELWRKFDHVSFERVASGVGIPNLYDFLRSRRGGSEDARPHAEQHNGADRTRPILEAALDPAQPDPMAHATMVLFLQILGTEAANLALKMLATGGVYLAGGIAQALRDALRTAPFLHAFTRAGRFSATLERVPVNVVMGEVALLGAASEGLRMLAGPPVM